MAKRKASRKRNSSSTAAAARALSKLGAAKGGRARAAKLTPAERSDLGRRAAEARWGRGT